jgi:hypothetical protein
MEASGFQASGFRLQGSGSRGRAPGGGGRGSGIAKLGVNVGFEMVLGCLGFRLRLLSFTVDRRVSIAAGKVLFCNELR